MSFSSSALSIDAQIAAVNEKIDKVETDIAAAATKWEEATAEKVQDHWSEEKKQLRKKEEQLRKKEEQLREEKKQLREKEIILLKQQQPQQPPAVELAAQFKQLGSKLDEVLIATKSEDRSFSGANPTFARNLLANYDWTYTHSRDLGRTLDPFSWKMTDDSKEDEEARTDDAVKHLSTHLSSLSTIFNGEFDSKVEIVNVCKQKMWPLKHNHNTANGKTDLAVCEKDVAGPNFLSYAMGLVELKTSSAKIKEAQVVFELVSASRMSKFKQGVVILATDLNKKWWIAWFDKVDSINIRVFQAGSVALSFFQEQLESAWKRSTELKPKPQLPPISEDRGGHSGGGGNSGDGGNSGGGGNSGDGGASNVATHSLEQDIAGCLPDAEVETFNEHTFRHMLARELFVHTGCAVAF